MRILWRQLTSLPVETLSGKHLGHIVDVVIDSETLNILQLIVRSSLIRRAKYHIGHDQVVRIESRAVIVADTTVIVTEQKSAVLTAPKPLVPRESL